MHTVCWGAPLRFRALRLLAEGEQVYPIEERTVQQIYSKHQPKRPALHSDRALHAARRLGAALGIHYRIDLYITNDTVYLGEFTPWHGLGKHLCAMELVNGKLDACAFGRLWNEHGELEGGHNASVPPPAGFIRSEQRHRKGGDLALCNLLLQTRRPALHTDQQGRRR